MQKFINLLLFPVKVFVLIALGLLAYYHNFLPDVYFSNAKADIEVTRFVTIESYGTLEAAAVQTDTEQSSYLGELKIFGIIPVKEVQVNILEDNQLVVGGTPFGIKMFTDGVLVVSTSDVNGVSPSARAGLIQGDLIISMNGIKPATNEDVEKIIKQSEGSSIDILLIRDGREEQISLQPIYDPSIESYRGGFWVRDSSAGIGTLTFYDPKTGVFGGLGHPICDIDTGNILTVASGEIVNVDIYGAEKSVSGESGELLGKFRLGEPDIGTVEANNETGIYGEMLIPPEGEIMSVGYKQEVEIGPAYILTTVDESGMQRFDIEIEKIQSMTGNTKNLVIRVTDPDLLEATGGIVHGMSGSPIIQNDKIIGAVTHVFVNDPQKGYGIFIENMLSSAQNIGY